MDVKINSGCIGCGMCETLCPDVFEMSSEGVAEVKKIPGVEDIGKVNNAADNCPVGVIEVK